MEQIVPTQEELTKQINEAYRTIDNPSLNLQNPEVLKAKMSLAIANTLAADFGINIPPSREVTGKSASGKSA